MTSTTRATFSIRPAKKNDADDLANLVVMAGDGLPLVAWETMRQGGETAMDVGRRRARRPEGSFSYRNADVAVVGGKVVAAIVSYPLPPDTDPEPHNGVPPLFRPLVMLENAVIPSWYINVLATYPAHQRQGTATALLAGVEAPAKASGYDRMSLITGDINPALQYYHRLGFEEISRTAIVKDGWDYGGKQWVLMTKPIS